MSAYAGLKCAPDPASGFNWYPHTAITDARDAGDCRQKFADEELTFVAINYDVCIVSVVDAGGAVSCNLYYADTNSGYPDPRDTETGLLAGEESYAFHWTGYSETWTEVFVPYTPEDVSAFEGLTCDPAPEYTWNYGGDYSNARDPGDCRQKFVTEEGTLVDAGMDVCIISDVIDGGGVTCEIGFAPTTQGYPDPRVEQTTAGKTHYAFHWHGATETWTVFVPPVEEEEEEVVEEEVVEEEEEEAPPAEEEEEENTDEGGSWIMTTLYILLGTGGGIVLFVMASMLVIIVGYSTVILLN